MLYYLWHGHLLLQLAHTTNGGDADLWKDSFWKGKVERYFCFTKEIKQHQQQVGKNLGPDECFSCILPQVYIHSILSLHFQDAPYRNISLLIITH